MKTEKSLLKLKYSPDINLHASYNEIFRHTPLKVQYQVCQQGTQNSDAFYAYLIPPG